MKRAAWICALLLLATAAFAAEKYADLKFRILKEDNGRPVRNASVVLHPVDAKGHQESGGLELKTNSDGEAEYRGIPMGKLRVQVLARGFQTYGEDHEIKDPEQVIVIKLKRPRDQYSIYEDQPKTDQSKPK